MTKFPGNARDKWNSLSFIQQSIVKDPELLDFIDFINDETFLASDLLFSQKALKMYVEKDEKYHLKKKKKMKSCASNTTSKIKEEKGMSKKKLSVQFVKKGMIWTTSNSLTTCQFMREARC